jgi:hypothetical protein
VWQIPVSVQCPDVVMTIPTKLAAEREG